MYIGSTTMRPSITGNEEELVSENSDQHGSKTAAINYAIRQTFGSDDDPEIDPKIKQSHRSLWDNCIGSRMTIETAKSVLAQELQINQSEIKSTTIPRLENHGMINVVQGNWSVAVEISPPDPTEIDDEPAYEQLSRVLTNEEKRAHHSLWDESDEAARISIDDAITTISDELETFEYDGSQTIMQLADANAITVDLKDSQICVREPDDEEVINDSDVDDKMAEIDAAEPVRADGGSVDTDKSGEERD